MRRCYQRPRSGLGHVDSLEINVVHDDVMAEAIPVGPAGDGVGDGQQQPRLQTPRSAISRRFKTQRIMRTKMREQ